MPAGITPVSACGPARRFARPRWIRSRAGRSSSGTARCSCARSSRRQPTAVASLDADPASVVIVGGGAAGLAAADMLRREGYANPVTMISSDQDAPVDRPNLSKDYLAGEAQDDWIPLRSPEFYRGAAHRAGARNARRVDRSGRAHDQLESGTRRDYGALLIATGADPVRLPVPGADEDRFSTCARSRTAGRSWSKREGAPRASWSSARASSASRWRRRCGRAASTLTWSRRRRCRSRRVMGVEVGRFIQALHEAHGVVFHLGQTVASRRWPHGHAERRRNARRRLRRDGRRRASGDGAGRHAGLALDKGIVVNEYLETSGRGIFAAGDVARWPDRAFGRADSRRALGRRRAPGAGRGAQHPRPPRTVRRGAVLLEPALRRHDPLRRPRRAMGPIKVDGSLEKQDAMVSFFEHDRRVAVATISRDRASLEAEVELEQQFT